MYTNQKRFQERKEAFGTPVNEVDRVEGGSWLNIKCSMHVNYRTFL